MEPITLPGLTPKPVVDDKPLDNGEVTAKSDVVSFPDSPTGYLIRSPETGVTTELGPKETVRSPKWSYPFPLNFDSDDFKMENIVHYFGEKITKDFFLAELTRFCQTRWKEAIDISNGDIDKASMFFSQEFFNVNRRSGEDTPEKLAQQISKHLAETMRLKKAGEPREVLLKRMEELKVLKERQNKLTLEAVF